MIYKLFVMGFLISTIAIAQELSVQEEWNKFKAENDKVYSNPEEEQRRFQIFSDNLNAIRDHNKKYETGEVSWLMGINQFSDLTPEEFAKTHTGLLLPKEGTGEAAY